jgi:hypothetical protein
MARDIYNSVVDLGQPLAADATRLVLPDIGEEDMLVQNFSLGYSQAVSQLWEVGSSFTYFVAGRSQGEIEIARIVGAKGIGTNFINKYADVCNMPDNHFTLQFFAGCTDGSVLGSLTVEGAVITSIGYSVAAQDMIVNEKIKMMFARLTVGE